MNQQEFELVKAGESLRTPFHTNKYCHCPPNDEITLNIIIF
jgi:hypothetical protein